MKLWKLTNADGRTYGDTLWGEGVKHVATGDPNQPLCSDGWIHAYEHPLIALFLNPIHGNFRDPVLWEASGEPGLRDGALKLGCHELTTVRRVEFAPLTIEQRVRFAIGCALVGNRAKRFAGWARKWLSNEDRSAEAAGAAGAWAAADAAWAAAAAARAAADGAAEERAAAAWAEAAAGAAAGAAAVEAAAAAAAAAAVFDLIKIAEWAITDSTEPPQ
jgi:hypothetical protein